MTDENGCLRTSLPKRMVMCRELIRNKMDPQGETQWQGVNDIHTWF